MLWCGFLAQLGVSDSAMNSASYQRAEREYMVICLKGELEVDLSAGLS